VAEYMTVIHL